LYSIYVEIDVLNTQRSDIRGIQIALRNDFAFPAGTSPDVIKLFYPTLCLANTISSARNLIAQATAVSPSGSYWLPFINVNPLISKHEEEEKAEVAATIENQKMRKTSKTKALKPAT